MKNLALAYSMKKKAKAKMKSDSHESDEMPMKGEMGIHGNIVDRIMRKKYSEGGEVANDDEPMADAMPVEFDELALSDGLDSHYDAANSGDELGNSQEEEDRADIVSRVMRSRMKKDRNPRPA